ncbi:MAG TPA: TetR/AcrR family transcriptional regulator [Pseudolabrys sp.]|nr:TetR/AcrR family transcriptional regulator [Pseudolabrys sp.]
MLVKLVTGRGAKVVAVPAKAKRNTRQHSASSAQPRRCADIQPATASEAARLTRQDWINGAIRKLAQDSVAALRIDELASDLGVTKGSFYWHFHSREDLLDAVLESWRSLMVTRIKDLIGPANAAPLERLRNLLRIALAPQPDVPGGPFELTLRDWARRDVRVARLVREVDAERISFLEELYRTAGLNAAEAQVYAIAQMSFIIGSHTTAADSTDGTHAQRRRIAETLFIPNSLAGERKRP